MKPKSISAFRAAGTSLLVVVAAAPLVMTAACDASGPSLWDTAVASALGDGGILIPTSSATVPGSTAVAATTIGGTATATSAPPVTPFASPVTVLSDQVQFIFTVADIDGDKHLDIAGAGASALNVVLGDGTGSFGSTVVSLEPDGVGVRAIRFGDLNGDGKPDFVGLRQTGHIDIALGTGDGSFPMATSTMVATNVTDLQLGDATGDGNLDIVTLPGGQVFAGKGDGTFTDLSSANGASGGFEFTSALTDMDGDSHLDLVTSTGFALDLALGTASGSFGAPSVYGAQVVTQHFTVADVDQNGIPDAVADGFNGAVVLLNPGKGTPSTVKPTVYNLTGSDPSYVGVGSIDGDSNPDIVMYNGIADQENGGFLIFYGAGGGLFGNPSLFVPRSPGYNGLVVADVNEDGASDLVGLTQGSSVDVYLNTR